MNLHVLTGDRQAGKTSACRRLVEAARARGFSVSGILAPAILDDGRCAGYRVVDVATGNSTLLASLCGPDAEHVGVFHFTADGLALGRAALTVPADLIVVDEVGPLELAGGGWADPLDQMLGRAGTALLTVRRSLVPRVVRRWPVSSASIHDLSRGADVIIDAILEEVLAPRQTQPSQVRQGS